MKTMQLNKKITAAAAGYRLRYIVHQLSNLAHQISNSPVPKATEVCPKFLALCDKIWFIVRGINPPINPEKP